ncbi:MAG: protein kinase family protein [Cyanobacteria bacterium SIG31]|nr:protein kinase family protein [Cyanobacteria bacterium SIG31]
MNNKSEMHLIVLYSNARHQEKEILEDINKHLKIIECYDIEWSKEKFLENIQRFYRFSPRNARKGIKERGNGNLLLITAMDNKPDYRIAEALVGHEYTNVNLLNLKFKYRKQVGRNAIHSTVNQKEARRDLCLLLGISMDDYLKKAPKQWDGTIQHIKRDLVGAYGYKNFEEMFYVLNETTNYAVLRNYEMLPQDFRLAEHGDIDIIVENYAIACAMLNAKPIAKNHPKAFNTVNGEKIPYDIRHLEDNYYCHEFAKDMLSTRVLNKNGVYIFNDEYYFYSLIYHSFIHKFKIADDYYARLENLFYKLNLNKKYNLSDYVSPFDLYYQLLIDFMKEHDYQIIKPDPPTKFNTSILDIGKNTKYLKEFYKLDSVRYCKIPSYKPNYKMFEGYFGNNHVFIKVGSYKNACKNEYYTMQKLYKNNPENFAKPIYYSLRKPQNIVMQFIEGETLQNIIDSNKLTDELKETLITDIEAIAKTLSEEDIVHRNITPNKFILGKDNHFKLIDFKYAVSFSKYKEIDYISDNTEIMDFIKNDFSLGKYLWDDFYSMNKILESIGTKSEYIKNNIGKYQIHFKQTRNVKTFIDQVFSVKNEQKTNKFGEKGKMYKVIRLLGFKIKLGRKG